MTLNNLVKSYRDNEILNTYKANHENIIQALNLENDSRDDYEGREILELLQNAVDQVDNEGKIYISLIGEVLTVSNTGEPFNFEGVKSVILPHLSLNKRNDDSVIGQKGLGFRSILNWSNDISVYSTGLSIKFSEEFRNQHFKSYGIDVATPLLAAPEIIHEIDKKNYTTVIKITISDNDKIEEVKRQLKEIDNYTLLFLDKITYLKVRVNTEKSVFTRKKENEKIIIVENDESSTFDVFTKRGKINEKKYEMVIAYDDNIDPHTNVLYSYFATKIDFPIKWKCHVTFDLKTDRNSIKNSDENKELLSLLAHFICEKASLLSGDKNYKIFDSLVKTSQFPSTLNIKGNDFNTVFNEQFERAKVLPVFTGEPVSLAEAPMFYENSPFFFESIKVNNLLIESTDDKRNSILLERSRRFTPEELVKMINQSSSHWTKEEKMRVLVWWVNEYPKSENLPQLLKDKSGVWIGKSDSIFLDGNVINEFPGKNWVSLKIIDSTYQKTLIDVLKNDHEFEGIEGSSDTRKLLNWLNKVAKLSFTEQTTEAIVSPINASVKDNFDHSKEFIFWLFESHMNPKISISIENINLELNLPVVSKEVKRANKVYIDSSYNNYIGEVLFKETDFQPLVSMDELGISIEDEELFIEFLTKINVNRFPPIEKKLIEDDFFKNNYIKILVESVIRKTSEKRNIDINYIEFDSILELKDVLLRTPTAEIINWLHHDDALRNQLINSQKFGIIKYKIGQEWYPKEFSGNTPSYIKYLFNTVPWITIKEKRYAPNQIVFYEKLAQNIDGICGIKKADLIGMNISDEIIRVLDFKSDVSQLAESDYYSILKYLNLKTDPKGEISKHVYSKKLDSLKEKEDNPSYNSEGLSIYCTDGNFYLNTEVKYAINRPPRTDKSTHFMNVAYRNNSKNISKWFGVNSYKFESTYKSHLNSRSQKEWEETESDIITTISALLKLTDTNMQVLKSTRIVLCKKVENLENGFVENFDYAIKEKGIYYVKIPDVIMKELFINESFIETLVDIYISRININIDKDKIELYFSKTLDEQKKKLLKDNDIIWEEYHEKLWITDTIAKKILDWFNQNSDRGITSDEKIELNSINFYNQSLPESEVLFIMQLLKNINMDILDLNQVDKILNIDVRPYWRKSFKEHLKKYLEEFEQKCYQLAKYDDTNLKDIYLNRINQYKNFDENSLEVENSVYVDIESILKETFSELKSCNSESIDIDNVYNTNVKNVIKMADIDMNEFDSFIVNHNEMKSHLYFDIPMNLNEEIDNYREVVNEKSTAQKNNQVDVSATSTIKVKLQKNDSLNKEMSNNGRGERDRGYYDRRNLANEMAGESAEKIAYNELCKQGKVIWHSKYSEVPSDRNNLPPDGIVCDMWIRDQENGNRYFEVKSSKTEFEMTLNEYNSMIEHIDTYEVVLVNRDTCEISCHKYSDLEGLEIPSRFLFTFFQEKEEE
ncbi:sacsin N-terminal ATP-binding-like domain-containing protein [Vagococcus salmoninarum]|uniref:Protein NO VEIN C-terminal domain-containing protein n=1 Tax=Vagococcus salmoninarum TaxID=2739 RepID=A0A429ZQ03_9ENTE|nr:DUF3883 domain-containing protein [Vagococcus salmoninarum]MBE9390291.1 DUF3883 domain-containing protein [Vagococcus salmoninarum]RST95784.1 hypothetical protein CBF35_07410 [Vagococcus salmoninarum]